MEAEMIEKRTLVTVARTFIPFFWTQRVAGYSVPDMPHFESDGAEYFEHALQQSNFYLEYGSGGSTVLAAKLKKSFISVDSDKYFLGAVCNKIGTLSPGQMLIHSDVGINGPWGIPIFKSKTAARRRRWGQYPELPWRAIRSNRLGTPDLVMVDGRFRVACALTSLKYLKDSPSSTLLFDDYQNRPSFRVVEQFATLERVAGRMAVFRPRANPGAALDECLEQHLFDWR